jgi:hypothetical protein
MLKFFLRRQQTPADLSDTPHTEQSDPYLESIMEQIRLHNNTNPVTIKEQLKQKEIK